MLQLLFAALWDFSLAATFLITWLRPYTFGERMVHHLVFVMLVEFLIVHATGFLSALSGGGEGRRSQAFILVVLTLLYMLFAAAFSAMYGGPWPVFALLMLIIPKVPVILSKHLGDDAQFAAMAHWAAMTALYLFGCFATLVYEVPPLGVTPEVIAAQGFTVDGEWPEQPYRVLAFGVIYFSGLGTLHIVQEIWARRPRRVKEEGWLP